MFTSIASIRVVPIIALGVGLSLGLGGCAAQAEEETMPASGDTAAHDQALPIAGAGFVTPAVIAAPIGFAGALGTGTVSGGVVAAPVGGTTFGGGTNFTGGTVGTNVGTGGPIGFNGGFSTGPIGFSSNFSPPPMNFSTGGGTSTSVSSDGTGMPVFTTNCTGFGCP